MNAEHRRPLYRPFSEPATDTPVQPSDDRARLLAVERVPFLEPPADDAPFADASAPAPAAGGRRRLGPGALAAPSAGDRG